MFYLRINLYLMPTQILVKILFFAIYVTDPKLKQFTLRQISVHHTQRSTVQFDFPNDLELKKETSIFDNFYL